MTDKDLDGWIALKIMGWRRATNHWVKGNKLQYAFDSWHPTESISDAFQVVEKMREDDFWFSMSYKEGIAPDFKGPGYMVRFRCVRGATRGDHIGYAETAPLAICLAAKKAIEGVE